MKKMLKILAVFGLITASSATFVSFTGKSNSEEDTINEPNVKVDEITDLNQVILEKEVQVFNLNEAEILQALGMVNENLNINEIQIAGLKDQQAIIIPKSNSTIYTNFAKIKVTLFSDLWAKKTNLADATTIKNMEVKLVQNKEEVLKTFKNLNPQFNNENLEVQFLNERSAIITVKDSTQFTGSVKIDYQIIHPISLHKFPNSSAVTKIEIIKDDDYEILKTFSLIHHLDLTELQVSRYPAPLDKSFAYISPREGTTMYTGNAIVNFTVVPGKKDLNEVISNKNAYVIKRDERELLKSISINNPGFDLTQVKVEFRTTNLGKSEAIISAYEDSLNYFGKTTVQIEIGTLAYPIKYLDVNKFSTYTDKELYEETTTTNEALEVLNYYKNNFYSINDILDRERTHNFLTKIYIKQLSLAIILYQKDYQEVQKIDDNYVVNLISNYQMRNDALTKLAVLQDEVKKYMANPWVNWFVKPDLKAEINQLINQISKLQDEEQKKVSLKTIHDQLDMGVYVKTYHFVQSDSDELSDAQLIQEITDLIRQETKTDAQLNSDFTISPIKRDKKTKKLRGQTIKIESTKNSSLLKDGFEFTINKDLSYLYDLMDWTNFEKMEANQLLAINEINRWVVNPIVNGATQTPEFGEDFSYKQNQNGLWELTFSRYSKIMSGRKLTFKVNNVVDHRKEIDRLNLNIKLDTDFTDQELMNQIAAMISEQIGQTVKYGTDFTTEEIARDKTTNKLRGQGVKIHATRDSKVIQGPGIFYLKKSLNYLEDMMDWTSPLNIAHNKLIAVNEINRWIVNPLKQRPDIPNPLEGYDYWFDTNYHGFLTLRFNPNSLILEGKDIVFNFN